MMEAMFFAASFFSATFSTSMKYVGIILYVIIKAKKYLDGRHDGATNQLPEGHDPNSTPVLSGRFRHQRLGTVQRKKIKEGQCEDRRRQQWARGRVGGTSETLNLVTCVNKSLTATALLSATNPSLPSIPESLL